MDLNGVCGAFQLRIYSKNRPEWVICEQGCFTQSIVTVPMYDTLGPESVAYVVKQCNLKTVLCSKETFSAALECQKTCPSLECLIVMDPTEKIREEAAAAKMRLLSVEEAKSRHHMNLHMSLFMSLFIPLWPFLC